MNFEKHKMIIIINLRICVDGWGDEGGQQTSVWRQAEDAFSFLNAIWLTAAAYSRFSQGSICMKFLHYRQLFCHRRRASPWRSDEGENLLVWASAPVTNTFLGAFTRQRVSSPALRHVTAEIRSPISGPAPLGLQVNRGKLYANVTFS